MFTEMINRIKKIQPSVLFCILIGVLGEEDLKKMAEADKEQAIRIVQEIYQRADSQMYKNKAKMKESEIVKNLVINGSGV